MLSGQFDAEQNEDNGSANATDALSTHSEADLTKDELTTDDVQCESASNLCMQLRAFHNIGIILCIQLRRRTNHFGQRNHYYVEVFCPV